MFDEPVEPPEDAGEGVAEDATNDAAGESPDAAALALERARQAAQAKGLTPGRRGPSRRADRARGGTPSPAGSVIHHGAPGTGPGFPAGAGRDPIAVGRTIEDFVGARGWREPMSVGGVIGRWEQVVGSELAAHATPETFVDGRLVVRTSSTAWATQLRLLLPQLERRLEVEIGPDVVTEIVVLGPGAPSWVKGPRVVKGRGPRDTYG